MRRNAGDPAGDDQSTAVFGIWPSFMRMPAVHYEIRPIERGVEELLVTVDLQTLWHDAIGVGQHAVRGNDRQAFDAVGPLHRRTLSPPRQSCNIRFEQTKKSWGDHEKNHAAPACCRRRV